MHYTLLLPIKLNGIYMGRILHNVYSISANRCYPHHLFFRWFAKRFLHPDIVSQYSYIFLWDEDLGVENFNVQR